MRFDIQLLRGLAILLVVAFHAGFGPRAGFLGVDVFFVVSGYLITRMVMRDVEAGNFRFSSFYTRRAKRLLPAAYVTLTLTTIAAMWLLTSREFIDFAKTVRGAVTFTANLSLLGQTGYFDGTPETKPLLHTWSLSIEEQYYAVLPLLLCVLPRRGRRPALWFILVASLAACLVLREHSPNAAFFRIEFRAWELCIGSLAGATTCQHRAVRWLYAPAVLVLVLLPWLPLFDAHPGGDALVIDVATAIVLVRNHAWFTQRTARRWLTPLARLGDISYSWYLLHWPPLVLLYACYLGAPPSWAPAVVAVGTCALAAVMYRYVEQPVRHHPFRFTLPRIGAALVISSALVVVPYAWTRAAQLETRAVPRADNVGLDPRCDFDTTTYAPLARCDTASSPRVLVWGDSLAMHLVPGLARVSAVGVRQATKLSCGPLLGVAPVNYQRLTVPWARACIEFNHAVLAQLAMSPSIETVVLASSFERFANPAYGDVLRSQASGVTTEHASVEVATQGLRQTVEAVTKLGKRVVIVAPPPSASFDVGACLERRAARQPTYGPHADCQIADADRRERQHDVLALLATAAQWPGVTVIDLAAPLCDAGQCRTIAGGVPLYLDDKHFSVAGSVYLALTNHWETWTAVASH